MALQLGSSHATSAEEKSRRILQERDAKRPPAALIPLATEERGPLRVAFEYITYPLRYIDYAANVAVYAVTGPQARGAALRLARLIPDSFQIPLLGLAYALYAGKAFDVLADAALDLANASARAGRLSLFALAAVVPVALVAARYTKRLAESHAILSDCREVRKHHRAASFLCLFLASVFLHPGWPVAGTFLGVAALLAFAFTHLRSLTWAPTIVTVFERAPAWDLPPIALPRHIHRNEATSPDDDLFAIPDRGSSWDAPEDIAASHERYWTQRLQRR